jgi:peptidyl-prolyl cis-trans isomerase SurA
MKQTALSRVRRLFRIAAVAGLLGAGLVACAERDAPSPAPASPDVWATVDGREIHRDQVERAYRRIAPPDATPSDDEMMSAKLNILDELIVQSILLERARVLNVEVPDTDVETAFSERRSNIPNDVFDKELQQRGLTVEDMKRDLRRDLVIQRLLEREVGAKISIGDEAVRAFYDENREQFNVPETQYRIAQIVITPQREPEIRNRRNDDATSPAEAQRKLQMLLKRLESGEDFAVLAADYSEDPQTAPLGGDLGFVPESALNQVAPQLRQAVLKSKPGQVTTVSAGGSHVILLVVARQDAGQRDLASPGVREGITDMLRDRREQLLSAAYVAAARNDARVVNHLARQIVEGARAAPAGLAPAAPGRP